MKYWFQVMKDMEDWKYPEQVAYLKEEHGFSQAHANALVMFSRGSKSSKRFDSFESYLKQEEPDKAKTIKKIYKVIQSKYPKTEIVIAWNQPMLKFNDQYIFGVSAAKSHLLLAPFDPKILAKLEKQLKDYVVLKKTVRIPVDWKVDEKLVLAMIKEGINNVK